MSCPHSLSGQPACHIVPNPDHPADSFCVTCGRRFSAPSSDEADHDSDKDHKFLVMAIAALLLILLLKLAFSQYQGVSPEVNPDPYQYKNMNTVQGVEIELKKSF